jgi:hypothetical protein
MHQSTRILVRGAIRDTTPEMPDRKRHGKTMDAMEQEKAASTVLTSQPSGRTARIFLTTAALVNRLIDFAGEQEDTGNGGERSCSPTFKIDHGLVISRNSSAAASEVGGSFSRLKSGASRKMICMQPARTADGVPPTMRMKNTTTGFRSRLSASCGFRRTAEGSPEEWTHACRKLRPYGRRRSRIADTSAAL